MSARHKLEAFSADTFRQPAQATTVARLVQEELENTKTTDGKPGWMELAEPLTVQHFRTVSDALHNIRQATVGDLNSRTYIVREPIVAVSGDTSKSKPGPAIGLARLICNQSIIDPRDGSPLTGTMADYWLQQEYSPDTELHLAVADKLLRISGEFALSRRIGVTGRESTLDSQHGPTITEAALEEPTPLSVFAVVPVTHPNPPLGLMHRLQSIGNVEQLATPPAFEDRYDVIKGGQLAQLYCADMVEALNRA